MKHPKPLCNESASSNAESSSDPNDWESIPSFATNRPYYKTESGLRHEIAEAEDNGLLEAGAILRVGGRLFLSPSRYFAHWQARNAQPSQGEQLELDLEEKQA